MRLGKKNPPEQFASGGFLVDAVGGSSNQFREDVLRLYDLAEYIRMQDRSVQSIEKNRKMGRNGQRGDQG